MPIFLKQLKSILIKDLLIEYSYKIRFAYSISFIFIQLLIFYYFASFIESSYEKNYDSNISNLFGFFLLGICILDISFTIISYTSMKVEEYKKIGVFEEIFILPIKPTHFIIFSSIYPIIFSVFKLFIYFSFCLIFFDVDFIHFNSFFIFLATIFCSFLTFVGISLIASSLSILFYKGSSVSIIHNSLSVLFGGVLYPASFISENFKFIEFLIPLHAILDLLRYSLGVISLSTSDINSNIYIIISHSIIFLAIGIKVLDLSFKKAFKEGRISFY